MALHFESTGHGSRTVLLHGFTQNARCWGTFGTLLATARQVVAVDAPGHGRSGHDDADLPTTARLIGEVGGTADYIGYSMGGRAALHLALEQPELVRSLVLIGATGGIDDDDERRARRHADEELARRLDSGPLAGFLDAWLAGPLFADLDREQACRDQRLRNRAEGLAASLRHCGTGSQAPLWSRLAVVDRPVLVVAGERDPKFRALGERLVDAIGGNATLWVQPGAGHAVHLEQPEATAERVLAFLTG